MNAVQIILADGTTQAVAKKMTLKEMQGIVGGWIEVVRSNVKNRSLVVNEEGLLRNLPLNEKATKMMHKAYKGQVIVGNAILVKS